MFWDLHSPHRTALLYLQHSITEASAALRHCFKRHLQEPSSKGPLLTVSGIYSHQLLNFGLCFAAEGRGRLLYYVGAQSDEMGTNQVTSLFLQPMPQATNRMDPYSSRLQHRSAPIEEGSIQPTIDGSFSMGRNSLGSFQMGWSGSSRNMKHLSVSPKRNFTLT